MLNQDSVVENWDRFLQSLSCTNVNDQKYQCNNPSILISLTSQLIESYTMRNKFQLSTILEHILKDNKIDLVNDDYFVKISSISGKDIVATEEYDEDITEFWSVINRQNKKLIMKSVDMLCEYLLSSERIAMYIQNDKHIVFRKWITYNVEEEFRCFIYNKKLVAISQYEYGNYLPNYVNQPDLVSASTKNFINQIICHIPFDNIVIDLAVHIANMNVYFIEFNSFGSMSDTDAGLYDWINDDALLHGNGDHVDIRLYDPKWIEAKYTIV